MSLKARAQPGFHGSCRRVTCGTALQAGAVRRDERGVACLPRLTHAHFEGAAHHVAPVELDVDGVDAVLVGNEPHGILVCKREGALLP